MTDTEANRAIHLAIEKIQALKQELQTSYEEYCTSDELLKKQALATLDEQVEPKLLSPDLRIQRKTKQITVLQKEVETLLAKKRSVAMLYTKKKESVTEKFVEKQHLRKKWYDEGLSSYDKELKRLRSFLSN